MAAVAQPSGRISRNMTEEQIRREIDFCHLRIDYLNTNWRFGMLADIKKCVKRLEKLQSMLASGVKP